MKNLYLVIFSLGFIFISCNKDKKNKEAVANVMTKDSLQVFKKLYEEVAYFSIDKNENAQKQFAPQQIEVVMAKVVKDFSELNNLESGNPLIPKDNSGTPCKVNKMSVINHQWLIIDFYSEDMTGEVLIKYIYQPDGVTNFTVLDTTIY
mgnify:FL=1